MKVGECQNFPCAKCLLSSRTIIGSEKSINSKACVGGLRWKIWDEEDTSNPQMCEKFGLCQHLEVEENYILACSDIWRLKKDLVIQTKNRY